MEELKKIKVQVQYEKEQRKNIFKVNQRKKFNFLPLIFELLKHSAEKGTLEEKYKNAK